jgi:hypothetical protein
MPLGWTVEITTEQPCRFGTKRSSQLFDVAIEDRDKALEAAMYHARGTILEINTRHQLPPGTRLSPGRIIARGPSLK